MEQNNQLPKIYRISYGSDCDGTMIPARIFKYANEDLASADTWNEQYWSDGETHIQCNEVIAHKFAIDEGINMPTEMTEVSQKIIDNWNNS